MSKRLDDLNAKLLRTFGAGIDGPVAFLPSFRRDDGEARALQSRFMDTLGDLADARAALGDAMAKLAAVPRAPVEIAAGAIAPSGPAGDGSPTVRAVPRYDGAGLMRYIMLYGPKQTVEARILRDGAGVATSIELRPVDEQNLRNGDVPPPGPPQ